eukprot:TRINITY_DN59741_c0_g1_i1.p1 TRINITY_DN59741_c0_g1~~TRINITY_DN59741_c0_g1_i1.p1  ORF type:complete len:184 (-),score=42.95 TRINITY_DN59741_c0_g1_i1:164-715(-)
MCIRDSHGSDILLKDQEIDALRTELDAARRCNDELLAELAAAKLAGWPSNGEVTGEVKVGWMDLLGGKHERHISDARIKTMATPDIKEYQVIFRSSPDAEQVRCHVTLFDPKQKLSDDLQKLIDTKPKKSEIEPIRIVQAAPPRRRRRQGNSGNLSPRGQSPPRQRGLGSKPSFSPPRSTSPR